MLHLPDNPFFFISLSFLLVSFTADILYTKTVKNWKKYESNIFITWLGERKGVLATLFLHAMVILFLSVVDGAAMLAIPYCFTTGVFHLAGVGLNYRTKKKLMLSW